VLEAPSTELISHDWQYHCVMLGWSMRGVSNNQGTVYLACCTFFLCFRRLHVIYQVGGQWALEARAAVYWLCMLA